MLLELTLHDFVLVKALDLEFDSGFTVLTGETGAGKSILVDALQLTLGARGDVAVVREGSEKTDISALFNIARMPGAQKWLTQAGFETPDNTVLLRRTIDLQGKSRAWINSRPVTIAMLREFGELLVDIHGQHAWQSLSQPSRMRELLDAYAHIDSALLQPLWQRRVQTRQALETARERTRYIDSERDRLNWQIEEVGKLAPEAGEWENLNSEHTRLSHAQMLLDAVTQASNAVSENADSSSEQLGRAMTALAKAADIDPELADILKVLGEAQALLEDANHSLTAWLRHTDLDPERLQALDERIATWLSLARRYHRPPQELPLLWQNWQRELAELEASTNMEALTKAAQQAEASWEDAAKTISAQRHKAAPCLAQAISTAIQQLGMTGGRFDVRVTPLSQPQASGIDQIEFLVAGHAGATPRAIGKVASGGELSRLALAIAVTTSQAGHVPTLIFDEVDSGIGGEIAQTVGLMMQQLGQDRQVLAVTHLAQVAAYAHHHLVVSKQTQKTATPYGTQTWSQVAPVREQSRAAEIARMLGSGHSSAGMAHAQEMLAAAHSPQQVPSNKSRHGKTAS